MARINKCIELIEQNQAIFSVSAPELSYECGKEMSQTWADMIQFDFEHHPFDTVGLQQFMKGLKDGGPTPSGHPTPTVITTLPSNCMTSEEVIYNAWQARHVLGTGVHGILHTHTRRADAVAAFVATCRYVFQTIGRDQGIAEGLRGGGGQRDPAAVWDSIRSSTCRKPIPGRLIRTASSCSASRSRTGSAFPTPTTSRPSLGSRSPSGALATWACHTAIRSSTTRLTLQK